MNHEQKKITLELQQTIQELIKRIDEYNQALIRMEQARKHKHEAIDAVDKLHQQLITNM